MAEGGRYKREFEEKISNEIFEIVANGKSIASQVISSDTEKTAFVEKVKQFASAYKNFNNALLQSKYFEEIRILNY